MYVLGKTHLCLVWEFHWLQSSAVIIPQLSLSPIGLGEWRVLSSNQLENAGGVTLFVLCTQSVSYSRHDLSDGDFVMNCKHAPHLQHSRKVSSPITEGAYIDWLIRRRLWLASRELTLTVIGTFLVRDTMSRSRSIFRLISQPGN